MRGLGKYGDKYLNWGQKQLKLESPHLQTAFTKPHDPLSTPTTLIVTYIYIDSIPSRYPVRNPLWNAIAKSHDPSEYQLRTSPVPKPQACNLYIVSP